MSINVYFLQRKWICLWESEITKRELTRGKNEVSKIQETMVIVSSRSAGTLSVRRLIYKTVKRLIDILAGFAGCLLLIPLYFYVRYRNHR